MKILFLHPNMPGQYKHLARKLAEDPDNQVVFLTKPKPGVELPNVTKIEYQVKREPQPETHRYIIGYERGVLASQEVWRVCKKLKEKGFVPDVICGHFGWGDGLFLKDIFYDTPILSFLEFFYDAHSGDVKFLDGENLTTPDEMARIRMKNGIHLFNLTFCDWGITPTYFQRDRHPALFHPKISVLHDGIDTDYIQFRQHNGITLPGGVALNRQDHEIVTYVSRNFEPYRGFPQFVRAAEILLKKRPKCHIILVGQDGVSYGRQPEGGKTYRQQMMEQVDLDLSRFHALPYQPYDTLLRILQTSDAHVYLTVPFVLSWSMMESMAAGCALIGSDTEPVREVLTDNVNALLADFHSPEHIAARVIEALDNKENMMSLRKTARKTIEERYALNKVLPLHIDLVRDVAAKRTPPEAHRKIQDFSSQVIEKVA